MERKFKTHLLRRPDLVRVLICAFVVTATPDSLQRSATELLVTELKFEMPAGVTIYPLS